VPLPGPETAEFEAAYQAALMGQPIAKPTRQVEAHGSIGALIASYLRHAEYIGLRESTKFGYASRIETLRTKHGHRSVAGLTRERIVTGILQPYADRPGAALAILKMLRILIRHANNIGWLKGDPSRGIKRPKTNEVRSWTDAEIGAFEKHWPIGTKQRLAFALHLYTGQRRSDPSLFKTSVTERKYSACPCNCYWVWSARGERSQRPRWLRLLQTSQEHAVI